MEDDKQVIDLFSGVGGFSLGFERTGFSISLAVDNSAEAVSTYQRNFPKTTVKNLDLSEVGPRGLREGSEGVTENVDVVIGGPPCQGFSLMGKRNTDDERNNLLIDFANHIKELSPDYFVMENVAGLKSGEARGYLDKFIKSVRDGGYEIVEPGKILDAADFGIPQRRSRLFVLGYLSELQEPDYPSVSKSDIGSWDAIKDLPNEPKESDISDGIYTGYLGEPSQYVSNLNAWDPFSENLPNGLTGLEPVDHEERVRERFDDVESGERDKVSRYHRLKKSEPSVTLRAGSDRDRGTHTAARPIHPVAPRVITVREAARLQSFPDWFQFHDTKYYGMRQIGNSVPPLLAKKIGGKIMNALENTSRSRRATNR
jgi:DNA (cytosine-5)-methyltransferase 1